MAVDEAARHQLYNSLESALGTESTLYGIAWATITFGG